MNYLGLNEIWESIQKDFPIVKELSEIVSDGSKIISTVNKAREMIIKNKIRIFFESLNKISNTEINEYLKSMEDDDNKKTLLIETLNKVIDLDDNLQIYILAYLVKVYKINNELNYHEKQLFYNISTFSEDDFKIFYCIYSNEIKENIKSFYLTSYVEKEIIAISLNKFSHLGFIHISTSFRQNEQDDIGSRDSYKLSEYSETLFLCLKGYFINVSCDEIIEQVQYGQITGGFRR